MSFVVRIEGMEELKRKLKQVADSVGAEKVSPILYDSADTITQKVQSNVNAIRKKTGRLRRSPVTRQMPGTGNEPKPAISAIDRKIAPHAWLVEYKHGKGFFRKAWDEGQGEAKKKIEEGLKKLIEAGAS